MSKTVALVLDPSFGEQLQALAQKAPVWIVSSPLNDRAVAALRPKFEDSRITTLLRLPNERSADTLARALLAIDEHHGGEGCEAIDVYGTKDLPSAEVSSQLGFRSVVATHSGFMALK
jgi:hypothetical protein